MEGPVAVDNNNNLAVQARIVLVLLYHTRNLHSHFLALDIVAHTGIHQILSIE